ncbi:Peptidyl-tRNA hydrolase [Desulfurobacterium thermolithotrophum DSM 11699]|uniref:Peptidyl-tRNA hydrolase n=1 Tax=Desulfurobacterium thermolithotrophum (strain DSM 11699 / BSA) TaxID=868864 RepID=F0S467_DESTD|nr:aminoacyl-tRNA hydrolase [Desulfurobacterium thermolithotrophum]ADY73639.1 Peptidyl-tRNA hydrolase [Desulfurobacterium thermolithotrophum DSM 11699]
MIRLIVGLGNPGKKYEKTRHNVGWMVLDRLAEVLGTDFSKEKFKGKIAELRNDDGKKIFLLKPITYMNLSGESVGELAKFYKIKPEETLVIYDDLDLPLGKLRLRLKGSSGGHKGVASIEQCFGSQNFSRLRIGIGRPQTKEEVVNYVLSPFREDELEALGKAIDKAVSCLKEVIKKGDIDNKIMSKCN